MTFRQARHYKRTAGRPIDLLVVHSMELDEKPSTAEGCANYFATTTVKASAHACVDVDSRVDCVLDRDVAYAAPGANHDGLHLELAGRARQTRAEWLDDYSRRMLEGPAAGWLAEKSSIHRVPLVYVDAVAIQRGERGVTTHNEVTRAFRQSTHTDPGKGFPMDVLLDAARAIHAPRPKVIPMFEPAVSVVDALDAPLGGCWLLGSDGAIYTTGNAPYLGGMNDTRNRADFAGRRAARLELFEAGYRIVATSGEKYVPRR